MASASMDPKSPLSRLLFAFLSSATLIKASPHPVAAADAALITAPAVLVDRFHGLDVTSPYEPNIIERAAKLFKRDQICGYLSANTSKFVPARERHQRPACGTLPNSHHYRLSAIVHCSVYLRMEYPHRGGRLLPGPYELLLHHGLPQPYRRRYLYWRVC